MATPQSVKKAAKAADAIHAQVYTQQGESEEAKEIVDGLEQQTPEQKAAAEQAAAKQVEQEEAERKAADEKKAAEKQDEKAAQEAAEKAEAEAKARRAQEQEPAGELEELRNQYKAQVGRNEALRKDLQGLQQVLATLQAQKAEPPEIRPETLLSEDEIAEFGPDLVDVIRRAVQEQVNPLLKKVEYLENTNNQLQQNLGNVSKSVATSAREALLQRLHDWNPGWEAINTDASFLQWLDQVDAFAGRKRIAMLREAFENNDADRVIRFFEAFTKEATISSSEPGGTPAAQNRPPQADLSSLVAPGRSRGGPEAGSQGEKKVWTQREIAQFYRDVTAGKFAGNEKERNRLERDIIAAAHEPGRIIP